MSRAKIVAVLAACCFSHTSLAEDLPQMPPGTELLSKSGIEDTIVGNTIEGKGLGDWKREYYNPNGRLKVKRSMFGGFQGNWRIQDNRLCRKFVANPQYNSCWLVSAEGDRVRFYDIDDGALHGELKLRSGNPGNL